MPCIGLCVDAFPLAIGEALVADTLSFVAVAVIGTLVPAASAVVGIAACVDTTAAAELTLLVAADVSSLFVSGRCAARSGAIARCAALVAEIGLRVDTDVLAASSC